MLSLSKKEGTDKRLWHLANSKTIAEHHYAIGGVYNAIQGYIGSALPHCSAGVPHGCAVDSIYYTIGSLQRIHIGSCSAESVASKRLRSSVVELFMVMVPAFIVCACSCQNIIEFPIPRCRVKNL